jgi:hypothetical protein
VLLWLVVVDGLGELARPSDELDAVDASLLIPYKRSRSSRRLFIW